MSRAEMIKHAIVFVASVVVVWLAGIVPGLMTPSAAAPAGPADAGSLIAGILAVWPIFFALAIMQALTFHYVKKFTTPIYLAGVFVLALLLAWRYSTAPQQAPAPPQPPPAATSSQ
jgi:hypothetical protein